MWDYCGFFADACFFRSSQYGLPSIYVGYGNSHVMYSYKLSAPPSMRKILSYILSKKCVIIRATSNGCFLMLREKTSRTLPRFPFPELVLITDPPCFPPNSGVRKSCHICANRIGRCSTTTGQTHHTWPLWPKVAAHWCVGIFGTAIRGAIIWRCLHKTTSAASGCPIMHQLKHQSKASIMSMDEQHPQSNSYVGQSHGVNIYR